MTKVAKIFMNGRSQAVRLPAEFRFDGDEVYIEKDEVTGNVILSSKPKEWDDLFSLISEAPAPEDFLSSKERDATQNNEDPFHGWLEK